MADTQIATGKRIVLKIGSALLVDQATGAIRSDWLKTLVDDIANARAAGQEIVLVTSGAIALGRQNLGLSKTAGLRLDEKQAAAACGNIRLAHAYQDLLNAHDLHVGQILMTLEDSENRRRYINARNTMETLLSMGVIPLINENDTVATDEIRFGDNDRLAARVAAMVSADTLVLFSDIEGLYSADPSKDPTATFIPHVTAITPEIEAMAGGAASAVGSGGMTTKIAAAKIAMAAGCRMVITKGERAHPLMTLDDGAQATWFLPSVTPKKARKQWIGGSLKTKGKLFADEGCVRALLAGKSLLPIGVTALEGTFTRGDAVEIIAPNQRTIARGLIAYNSDESQQIIGKASQDIEQILGYRGRDVLIHRDDLVLEE